jgi:macrolide-specific efflux system membrane fusion protein
VVLYTVLLDVDNADNALMAEMTTQVFSSPAGQGVLTVPVAALQGSTTGDLQTARWSRPTATSSNARYAPASATARVQIVDGLNEGDHLLIGPADGSGG